MNCKFNFKIIKLNKLTNLHLNKYRKQIDFLNSDYKHSGKEII